MLLPARLAATRGTAVAVSAAAATGTWNLRSCFIHRQPPSAKLLIVQLGNGTLGVVVRRHLDKGEATRSARVAIPHHRDALDVARLREQLLEILLVGFVGKVADVEFSTHLTRSCTVTAAPRRARLLRKPSLSDFRSAQLHAGRSEDDQIDAERD